MKWTSEEKAIIVKYIIEQAAFGPSDADKLQAQLPGRSSSQIADQWRKFIKPQMMSSYQVASSTSAPSTPKKRSRKEDDSDN